MCTDLDQASELYSAFVPLIKASMCLRMGMCKPHPWPINSSRHTQCASLLSGIPKFGRELQNYLFIYWLNLSDEEGILRKNDAD